MSVVRGSAQGILRGPEVRNRGRDSLDSVGRASWPSLSRIGQRCSSVRIALPLRPFPLNSLDKSTPGAADVLTLGTQSAIKHNSSRRTSIF